MGYTTAVLTPGDAPLGALAHIEPKGGGCAPEAMYRAAGTLLAAVRSEGERLLTYKGFAFYQIAGLGAPGKGYWRWDTNAVVQFYT